MLKLIMFGFIVVSMLVSGCATFQEDMRFKTDLAYHSKDLEKASEGWVLVVRGSKNEVLKTEDTEPSEIQFNTKVWYHPNQRLLLIQNNYSKPLNNLRIGTELVGKYSAPMARVAERVVTQTLTLLDLSTYVGVTKYDMFYNEVINPGNVGDRLTNLDGYRDPRDFYDSVYVKALMFRTNASLTNKKVDRSDGDVNGWQRWFSFSKLRDNSEWRQFLSKTLLYGGDEEKWHSWDGIHFFTDVLQIQYPGVYMSDEVKTKFNNPFSRDALMSTDTGLFESIKTEIDPALMEQLEARSKSVGENNYSGTESLSFYRLVSKLLFLRLVI